MNSPKRTNMKPEDRRNQLLDVAQYLFFTKGYDDTTMADILAAAGISKGGFYHHFKSKDELLFGVLDRMAEALFGQLDLASGSTSTSAMDQLNAFIHLRSDYLKEHDYAGQVEFFSVMNDAKNSSLLAAFKRVVGEFASPHLEQIIKQGCDEGVFSTPDAQTAADMILHIGDFFDPALKVAIDARGTVRADEAAAKLRAAMAMQYLTIDRVLGLPDGTTDFGWPGIVELTMSIKPARKPMQDHPDAET
ncbi:MAG: TetR/AcrR family transcriptional regulator [Pseudoruegeria sp.]